MNNSELDKMLTDLHIRNAQEREEGKIAGQKDEGIAEAAAPETTAPSEDTIDGVTVGHFGVTRPISSIADENDEILPQGRKRFTVSPPPEALDIRDPEPPTEEERKKREAYFREQEDESGSSGRARGVFAGILMFAMVLDIVIMMLVGAVYSLRIGADKNPDFVLFSNRCFFADEGVSNYQISKGDLVIFKPVSSGSELKTGDLVLCGDAEKNNLAFVSTSENGSVTIKSVNETDTKKTDTNLFVKGKYESHSPFLGQLSNTLMSPTLAMLLFILPLMLLILLPIYAMLRDR